MELTQKGKDKLKEVTPAVSKLHRGLLTTMGDMELEGFEKVLRKMEVFLRIISGRKSMITILKFGKRFVKGVFTKTTCETTRRVTRMFRLQSAIYRR